MSRLELGEMPQRISCPKCRCSLRASLQITAGDNAANTFSIILTPADDQQGTRASHAYTAYITDDYNVLRAAIASRQSMPHAAFPVPAGTPDQVQDEHDGHSDTDELTDEHDVHEGTGDTDEDDVIAGTAGGDTAGGADVIAGTAGGADVIAGTAGVDVTAGADMTAAASAVALPKSTMFRSWGLPIGSWRIDSRSRSRSPQREPPRVGLPSMLAQ